ncbi:MAG: hypothetical protein ACTSRC_05885, partial [Candidatus Helarchaeota archaeon]
VLFDVTAGWPLAYNVSWYGEYDRTVNTVSTYIITAGQTPTWFVNWSAQFPANAQDYQMNVSIPIDWNVSSVRNGTFPIILPYNSANWREVQVSGSKVVVIKNLTITTVQDWVIASIAPNYVTAIDVYKREGLSYVLFNLSETLLITETLHINGTISSTMAGAITDPVNSANLSIYLPSIRTCHFEPKNPGTGIANFTDWVVRDSTNEPGTYKVQVLWVNGTEVGLNEVDLKIIYPTTRRVFVSGEEQIAFPPYLDWFLGTDNQINVTVFYNNTFADKIGGISTTNASYKVFNESELITPWTSLDKEVLGIGFYNVTLDVTDWSNGTYYVTINLNKTGFVLQEFNITLNVVFNTTLTLIEPVITQYSQFYPENMTILVNYTKKTGEAITLASVTCVINGSAPIALYLLGNIYRIQLNSTDYGIGTYNVTVFASASGYKDRSIYIEWIVQTCPTNIQHYVNGSYSMYEFYHGESMKLTITYTDTQHSVPLANALVNLTIAGYTLVPITLTYDGNGNYSTVIDSLTGIEGLWPMSFLIQKPNYETHTLDLNIYTRHNTTLTWFIPPPSEIRPGDELILAVNLSYNPAGPIEGQEISFNITINGVPQLQNVTTNATGIALYKFFITSEMKELSIEVIYFGNTTQFLTRLASTSVSIRTGGILEQYWWVIVIGAVALLMVVAGVRVHQKQKLTKEMKKKEIITSFQDVTKILHLVVIHKGTGTDIFDYKVQERLDPTLLAGFIQAVKDFGRQLDQGGE